MKKSLLILSALFASAIGYTQTFVTDYITFDVTDITNKTVRASDYDVSGGTSVTVPATVTDIATSIVYQVTTIASNSFKNKGLISVVIEDGIGNIEYDAFKLNSLTSIVLPNSVYNIGDEAFAYNDLTSVTLPNIQSLSTGAFRDNNLANFNIPTTVTNIGPDALRNNLLTNIVIPYGVSSIGQQAFSDNLIETIELPISLNSIGARAFAVNPLISITSNRATPPTIITGGSNDSFNEFRNTIDLFIPAGSEALYVTDAGALWTGFNTVTEFGFTVDYITYAITSTANSTVSAVGYDMAGGFNVNIPASVEDPNTQILHSVTGIGHEAFKGKDLLTAVIPNGVAAIGAKAFQNNDLTDLILHNSVVSIGTSVFAGNQLNSLTISENLSVISESAFLANNLTNVVIPNSVTSIGNYAFLMNGLTEIVIPNNVNSIGVNSFKDNQLTTVTISNNIAEIPYGAFENNQLTDVIIPSSVTNIGYQAFKNNPLVSVTSKALVPPTVITGNQDSFDDRSGVDLIVPFGTTGPYVTDAGALWINFNSVTEAPEEFASIDNNLSDEVVVISTLDAINISHSNATTFKSYSIYNLSGKIVATGGQKEISTTFMANGIYILKLDFNEGTVVRKVNVN